MKMEKQFKKAWKSELDSGMYLSREMKDELIGKVISQKVEHTTKGKWIYPLVLTSFALGVAFLLLITIQNDSLGITVTSNQRTNTAIKIEKLLVTEKFYWMLGTIILAIITVLLFFGVIEKTIRWQSNKTIVNFNKLVSKKRSSLLFQVFCCFLMGAGIVLIANIISLYSFKLLTSIMMTLFNCFLLLWSVRKLNKADCPHCAHNFSRKELFKMTWAPYRLKCFQCEGDIYLSKASRNKSYLFIFIPFISHYGLGFLGIPFPLITFSFLLVGLFFNFYILNFTTSFSNKDEPLW